MYIICTKCIEDHLARTTALDLREVDAAILNSISVPLSLRSDDTATAANLTKLKGSWAGSAAFEARWISLTA